ncbi:MAG: TIGR02117 family protein [Sulfitobacter sp.]|uniref:TIGR02117 family protein n=1 Tax=Sulfitobacter sp. TaxID=1903071 RepID=UPI00405900B8|tara:strand:- start:10931 stop:11662 length:732 start_codon:yes stop_codon:yes gene_type:complete
MRVLRLQVHSPRLRGQSLKKLSRWLGLLAILPALYLMAAIYGAMIARSAEPGVDGHELTRDVLLLRGPIHYDILLPIDDLSRARFAGLAQAGIPLTAPQARWLVIGWGARRFYTETPTYSDLSLGNVWRGIIGDDSVLRVDVAGELYKDLPIRHLRLAETEYRALLDGIWESFALTPEGLPDRIDVKGYTSSDVFLAARGRFNILRTCNVWIGEQLRAAGVRFGIWTPLPLSVSLSFDLYHSE